jgi:hypothetical protein
MNNGSDWAIHLKSDTTSQKVQESLHIRNENATHEIRVSETAKILSGEIQVDKRAVTVNSPMCSSDLTCGTQSYIHFERSKQLVSWVNCARSFVRSSFRW